jgi:hypothetical protein
VTNTPHHRTPGGSAQRNRKISGTAAFPRAESVSKGLLTTQIGETAGHSVQEPYTAAHRQK